MAGFIFMLMLFVVVKSDQNCDNEIENTLKALLTPQEHPSLQVQVLRRQLLHKFQDAFKKADHENDMTYDLEEHFGLLSKLEQALENAEGENRDYKRSFSSLAQWNNLPLKRNLEALARAGLIRTLPNSEEQEDESNTKRSTDDLLDNGQLSADFQNPETKRGIESLARNGDLHRGRELQEFLNELYIKRNIDSLARNFNFPAYGKRYIGSVLRTNNGQQFSGKRNLASIVRENGKFNGKKSAFEDFNKRNLASIKAQYSNRIKRDDSYSRSNNEFPSPIYQSADDYEDLLNTLNTIPTSEKRFLGSVARSGWFRPSTVPGKRHIGSLARLGWLPTFRNVRRFNRSGRSTNGDSCRETSPDGQTKDNTFSEATLPLDNKRFLLQPAVDQIILKKMYPRTHAFLTDMS